VKNALAEAITEQQNSPQSIVLEEAKYLDGQIEKLYAEGNYSTAVPLAERALTLRQRVLGSTAPEVISSFNHLIDLYKMEGNNEQAVSLFEQAVNIWGNSPVPEYAQLNSPKFATTLNELAKDMGEVYEQLEEPQKAEIISKFSRSSFSSEDISNSLSLVIGENPEKYNQNFLYNSGQDRSIEEGIQIEKTIFYATDRNIIAPAVRYGNRRGKLSYGSCQVMISPETNLALLANNSTFIRPLKFPLSSQKSSQNLPKLLSTKQKQKDEFFAELVKELNETNQEAIVYIHGFATKFEDAVNTTINLTSELNFKAVPIFYSWPSQGNKTSYPVDETNNEWSIPDLKQFLHELASLSNIQAIHIIAHSMGNRSLVKALTSLFEESSPKTKSAFRSIVLVAPDIDSETFIRDYAPNIASKGSLITTLYASSKDWALKLSKGFHGSPRAGESGKNIVIVKGIDTLDATKVDTSLFGHSFPPSRDVISDIFYVLRGDYPGQRFGLIPIKHPQGIYWMIKR
jgi:esterase/lipase superfamily enzyme